MSQIREAVVVVVAAAAGGFAAAIVLSVAPATVVLSSPNGQVVERVLAPAYFATYFPVVSAITVGSAVVLGVPAFYVLKFLRIANFWSFVAVAASIGAFVGAWLALFEAPLSGLAAFAGLGAVGGVVTSLLLRLLGSRCHKCPRKRVRSNPAFERTRRFAASSSGQRWRRAAQLER